MHKLLLPLCLVFSATAIAQTQLPLPSFGSTFASTSATRGFYFQTPVAITITGLRVPDEAGIGVQCVEVTSMAGPAPVYPTTATGTQVFYASNVPSNVVIPCKLDFPAGAWIGVLGACGTTTMNSSYSGPQSGGMFASTLAGQPVTLHQLLTQTNLATAGAHPYSGNAQGLGQMGRIEVFYAAPPLSTAVGLPAFHTTNSAVAATRGLYFTTPVSLRIRGLRVPDETRNGVQNVEVKRLSAAPATLPATTSGGEVFYANNVPSHQIIPCNLLFNAGDTIGVLGACGTTTMRNSVGDPAGPFVTTIGGQAVTLRRLTTATNLNASQAQPFSADPTGRIGRIEVYYELVDGNATATLFGNGCEARKNFFEVFSFSSPVDLDGMSLRMEPFDHDAFQAPYHMTLGPGSFQMPPASATVLVPGATPAAVVLSTSFPFGGQNHSTMHVYRRGLVSLSPNLNEPSYISAGNFCSMSWPRWGCWHELSSHVVKYHETGSLSVFTWYMVPSSGVAGSTNTNTWQLKFDRATGQVFFHWYTMHSPHTWVVGFARGGGLPNGGRDLSATPSHGFNTGAADVDAPTLTTAGTLPVLGATLPLVTSDVPAGSQFGVLLLGFAPDNINLAAFDAPTCFVHVQPVATDAFVLTGPTTNLPLPIPNEVAFVGLHLYGQSATYTPGANPLSLLFSNGVDLRLDVQ